MKIILAQGNPGAQYTTSRHNVGFMALDAFAHTHGGEFAEKSKFHAYVAEVSIGGEKALLVKPTTFYNETGRAARALSDFYKLTPASDVLVVHDDLALPLGTLRVRQKGSDAGNNGIKSLNAHLSAEYTRIRVGIYSDARHNMPDAAFVLAPFTANEVAILKKDIIPKTHELIEQFCQNTLETTSYTIETEAVEKK